VPRAGSNAKQLRGQPEECISEDYRAYMRRAPVFGAFAFGLAAGIVVARLLGSTSPVRVETPPIADADLEASRDAGTVSGDDAGDGGDAEPRNVSETVAALAFPDPGWIPSTPRPLATHDLWVVAGVKPEAPFAHDGDTYGDIQHWPATRIVVLTPSGGSFTHVAVEEMSAAPISCDATDVVRRYYAFDLEDPAEFAPLFPGETIVAVRVRCDRRWRSGTDRGFGYLIVFVVDGANLRSIWSGRITESYTDVVAHREKQTDYVVAAEPPETLGKRRLCLHEGSRYGRYGQCSRWNGERYVDEL